MIDLILRTSLERGCIISIIYQDGKGNITKRNIKVYSIIGDKIKAYCYLRKEVRVFYKNNILAADLYRERRLA